MSISIKSPDQVEKMRTAGKLASSVLEMIGEHVKTGVTTDKLDQICHNFNYEPFREIYHQNELYEKFYHEVLSE